MTGRQGEKSPSRTGGLDIPGNCISHNTRSIHFNLLRVTSIPLMAIYREKMCHYRETGRLDIYRVTPLPYRDRDLTALLVEG